MHRGRTAGDTSWPERARRRGLTGQERRAHIGFAALLLGCTSFACMGPDEGLWAAPPPPLEEGRVAGPLDHDPRASRELASWLRTNCDRDLAYRMPVRASNVRGESAQFTPSALTDRDEATYWATDEPVTEASATIEFGQSTTFDHVVIREHVELGRRVEAWSLWVRRGEEWTRVARGSAIGDELTITFEAETAEALRLSIESASACPVLESIEVFSTSD